MNRRKAKAHCEGASSAPPSTGSRPTSRRRSWKVLGGTAAVVLVSASFAVPDLFTSNSVGLGTSHAMGMGAKHGKGLPVGSSVPTFAGQDLLTGKTIASGTLNTRKTLLFFSTGVTCQACFEQIQGLQKVGAELRRRGIQLVSITPDSQGDLRRAANRYRITTPLISDESRRISDAFNTLGLGMHATSPGHAFALIDKGKVLWYHDYWLPPDRVMYVPIKRLLADIPS